MTTANGDKTSIVNIVYRSVTKIYDEIVTNDVDSNLKCDVRFVSLEALKKCTGGFEGSNGGLKVIT